MTYKMAYTQILQTIATWELLFDHGPFFKTHKNYFFNSTVDKIIPVSIALELFKQASIRKSNCFLELSKVAKS